MQQHDQNHSLQAWTYARDFVPHLYIQGEIPTNGEKPMVVLDETGQQNQKGNLNLVFKPDVYDPNGQSELAIRNFEKMMLPERYSSVTIKAGKGEIYLKVENRSRSKGNETHSLEAWVYEEDLVPTLYIEGSISTNGEKPIVKLEDSDVIGENPQILMLAFDHDVYDPKGQSQLDIEKFNRPMKEGGQYSSVTITAKNGNIHLPIEIRNRAKGG